MGCDDDAALALHTMNRINDEACYLYAKMMLDRKACVILNFSNTPLVFTNYINVSYSRSVQANYAVPFSYSIVRATPSPFTVGHNTS